MDMDGVGWKENEKVMRRSQVITVVNGEEIESSIEPNSCVYSIGDEAKHKRMGPRGSGQRARHIVANELGNQSPPNLALVLHVLL